MLKQTSGLQAFLVACARHVPARATSRRTYSGLLLSIVVVLLTKWSSTCTRSLTFTSAPGRRSTAALPRRLVKACSASERFSQPSSDAPRIAWSFWDKGRSQLSDFRRLCVESWAAQNPDWEIHILDQHNVAEFLSYDELPKLWRSMYVPWQADAVRLALLEKYGGMWLDASTICLHPFGRWMYDTIEARDRSEEVGAFYFSSWGVEMYKGKEFVENWVMAARRRHPLIVGWKLLFNGYWDTKTRADAMSVVLDPPGVPDHPLFRGVDISHLNRFGQDLRNYLLMHASFKKLIDDYPEMRRIWQEDMVLLKADDTAFWHMEEPDVAWNTDSALEKWMGPRNEDWLQYVTARCPVLKFTRDTAERLDRFPESQLLDPSTCLGAAFQAALKPTPSSRR
eukprot:TRINITY_DN39893_c0_g1_i2.p1 TRINITY_DN39893_c0_g1~~TRINITY_DN39893_c0_g1_i2.p1  ORF type:complete len:396 (+),score=49.61 TRINITY_DN39893_c0_g1_i2:233-1420(+)